MFALAGEVNAEFLEQMEETGKVSLDDKNRITEYISRDWAIVLKGDHSVPAKARRSLKRRRDREGTSAPIAEDMSDDEMEVVGSVPGVPKPEPVDRTAYDELLNRHRSRNPEIQQAPPVIAEARNLANPGFDEPERKENVQLMNVQMVGATTNGSNSDGISLHQLVKQLEEMLIYLESDFTGLKVKILRLLAIRDEQLDAQDVILSLKLFLLTTTRKFRLSTESSGYPDSSKKCGKAFLTILKFVLLKLESPLINDFRKEIDNKIKNFGAAEKVILIVDAQEAIQQILITFSSSWCSPNCWMFPISRR